MTEVCHAWKSNGTINQKYCFKKFLKFLNIRFLKGGVSSQEEGFYITVNFIFVESRNIAFCSYLHYK